MKPNPRYLNDVKQQYNKGEFISQCAGTEWGLKTFSNPSEQTCAALWRSVHAARLMSAPPHTCRVSEPEKLVSLYRLQSLLWDDLAGRHTHENVLSNMLKLFPKQFSVDVRLLISRALAFPPSSFLPREPEPHESNYHVYERVSHNKRVSARPAEGCGSVPNSCPCMARARLVFDALPATMDIPRPRGRGAAGLARGQRALRSILEQRLGSLHSPLRSYSYFTNEGQSPTGV